MAVASKSRISKNGRKTAEPVFQITIPKMNLSSFRVKLVGMAPIIVHRFTEKAERSIQDKQSKKAAKAREARDPNAEYLAACYVFPGSTPGEKGCRYAITARCVKAATVGACRFISGLPMTFGRGAFSIAGEDDPDLIELKFSEMRMRTDAVRLPNGNLDLRYRPEFTEWSAVVKITYNAEIITPEQIVGLMAMGGFHCGLLEDRPSSKSGPGGNHGTFTVETA
ncbi:MAG: hypothetical protein V1755_06675 [Chloroflexota bacterium]